MPAVVFLMFSAESADGIRLGRALGALFSRHTQLLLSGLTVTVSDGGEVVSVVISGVCEASGATSCKRMFCRMD